MQRIIRVVLVIEICYWSVKCISRQKVKVEYYQYYVLVGQKKFKFSKKNLSLFKVELN